MQSSILLFDLDGTLIDSRADLATGVNLTRQEYGLPVLPLATVTSFVGDGIRTQMIRSFKDAPFEYDLEEVIAADKRHYAAHLLDETVLYPGVAETLPLLKERYRLGVVTNKPQPFVESILKGLGIYGLFDSVVGGGRCVKLKPDAEPLLLALSETGCEAGGSWMIGDHRTDLGAAVNAGLKGCFCAYGFGIRDNQPADAVVESFEELLRIV